MKERGLVVMSAWLLASPGFAASELPVDVANFLERREACDHWRGEEPYDAERRAEIIANACRACAGTDAELARLSDRYRNDAVVFPKLEVLDAKVEPDAANGPCEEPPANAGHASR